MQRPTAWKVLTIGAAMAGLSLIGAGTAAAAGSTSPDCQNIGLSTTRCQTNGSCQIVTAPPKTEAGQYGPFFWQNPSVGSASRSR